MPINSELRITALRALLGLLITATIAAGSTYLAVRDQLVRSEEWAKGITQQMQEQSDKLDGVITQLSETNQRLAKLEGVLSVR